VASLLLKDGGAEPNARDWRGSTPLHYACAAGHLEVVELLLGNAQTVPDLTDARGRTPLLVAAHHNQHHVLSALVKQHLARLSPLHCDVEGRSVVHYLSFMPQDVREALLQGVKDLNKKVQHYSRYIAIKQLCLALFTGKR
jgi:ankyrin repeat protein